MFDILPVSSPMFLNNNKISDGNLYLCQPHTVIQLVEVAPPPPRRISSVINSNSEASTSYSSSSSSSSFEEEEMDEDEEEESVCSSYCSSDCPPEALDAPQTPVAQPTSSLAPSESFSVRMKGILLWREHSDSPHLVSDASSSLKRKLEEVEEFLVDNSDTVSHTSKRSRSHGSSTSSHSISSEELNMHPCPACDAFFPTLQSLRQHGRRDAPHTNEACCVAVEYAFEQ